MPLLFACTVAEICVACALHYVTITSKISLSKMYEFSTHPLADPWLILVRPQWNGQSQTGLRPYPRSVFMNLLVCGLCPGKKKNTQT